LFGK